MIEKAKVVALNGNMARVQVKRASACGESCASCNAGCAAPNIYVDAVNDIKAAIGQHVEIETQTKIVFNAIILNYVLPLIMLAIGIASGDILTESLHLNVSKDLMGIVLGFALMALSYIFASQIDKSYKNSGKMKFIVKRIIKI